MCAAQIKNWLLSAVALLAVNGLALTASALPLAPSTNIDVSSGSGMATGVVSTGHQIFDFLGNAGDKVTLAVNVVEIGSGTVHTNDDTKLYLFNQLGKLETWNDNANNSLQSEIFEYLLPTAGTYYAAVTTASNRPLYNTDGVITGWRDIGMGNVHFNLNVDLAAPPTANPVPEPATMLLFGTGLVGAAGYRLRKRG